MTRNRPMNKSLQRIFQRFTCLMALVIFGVGCGGAVEEPQKVTEVAPEGTLTFTAKDPEKGLLSGTFEYDGYTIRFDVARGPEMAWWYQTKGNPIHQSDARLCDMRHYCFHERAGGHAFADPDWVPINENNSPTSEQAIQNSRTTWKLHQYLLSIGNADFQDLEEEYQILLTSTNLPPEQWGLPLMELQNELQKEKQLNLETPQKGVLAYVNNAAGTHYARFEIWWQYISFRGITVKAGEHTSTWTRVKDRNNIFTREYITCNHGACANDSGMRIFCGRDFYNRADQIPFNNRCNVPATTGTMHPSGTTNCCNTRYNANYWPSDGHVCNDDSALQLQMMIYNTATVYAPFCGDTSLARWAPSCG